MLTNIVGQIHGSQQTFTLTVRDGQETVLFNPKDGVNVSLDMPSTKGKRVFIGGDYNHLPDLREIKRHVNSLGYISIIPYECGMPQEYIKNYIHQFDMFLLGQCKYAIFEVTSAAGQLMELQRALDDSDCEVRVLYKARNKEQTEITEIPEHVSSMITTSVRNIQGYASFEDLPHIIKGFFPSGDILTGPTIRALSRARGAGEKQTDQSMRVLARILERERARQKEIHRLANKGGKK